VPVLEPKAMEILKAASDPAWRRPMPCALRP
jgi:hypothetical protein